MSYSPCLQHHHRTHALRKLHALECLKHYFIMLQGALFLTSRQSTVNFPSTKHKSGRYAQYDCLMCFRLGRACGSLTSSHQDSATTPGRMKHARLSTWPFTTCRPASAVCASHEEVLKAAQKMPLPIRKCLCNACARHAAEGPSERVRQLCTSSVCKPGKLQASITAPW